MAMRNGYLAFRACSFLVESTRGPVAPSTTLWVVPPHFMGEDGTAASLPWREAAGGNHAKHGGGGGFRLSAAGASRRSSSSALQPARHRVDRFDIAYRGGAALLQAVFQPCSGRGRRRYNLWASLVQANPNESKEKSLDLFGFLWPNRAFSKGYRGKNKKVWLRLNSRPGLRDSPLRGTS
jgi:hypothetical protein